MRRVAVAAILLSIGGCGDGGISQGDRQRALSTARAGMNSVRALPGGKQATFREVRLVGPGTICGTIDGNDGFGPRAFATTDGKVTLADPRDPATAAAMADQCRGPSREITSRNEQYSDLDVAD